MKRKMLPLMLMLIAGAIVSVMCYVQHYEIRTMLLILLVVLIVFYTIGYAIKRILDYFDKQNEKKSKDEGEVIEKEATEETDTEKE